MTHNKRVRPQAISKSSPTSVIQIVALILTISLSALLSASASFHPQQSPTITPAVSFANLGFVQGVQNSLAGLSQVQFNFNLHQLSSEASRTSTQLNTSVFLQN